MLTAFLYGSADDFFASLIYYKLGFQGMSFLFS